MMKTQFEIKDRNATHVLVVATTKKGRQFYIVYAAPTALLPDNEVLDKARDAWENPKSDFTPYHGQMLNN